MGKLDVGERTRLDEKALFVRLETLRLTRIAGAGHYSGTFSAAEILAALYYHELKLDPARPEWPERDRFVLSKGHAAIGLYPILADLGYFDPAQLETYTRLGSAFGDHPICERCAESISVRDRWVTDSPLVSVWPSGAECSHWTSAST